MLRREVVELALPLGVVGPALVVPAQLREDLARVLHMGLDDGGLVPRGFLLVHVEAHLEARAVGQRVVPRLDDDWRGRRLWRRREHEGRVHDVFVRLRLRVDQCTAGWDALERQLHLVERPRVDAEDDALGVLVPELELAGVGLVADHVGVVSSLCADLGALRVEPVLQDRARGAEDEEIDIVRLSCVPMDPRVRLTVLDFVVSDLHRVGARMQEESFGPACPLEHGLGHPRERVLGGFHLREAVVVAPRCDDRLALVAGGHERDERRIGRPRRARVEDDDLRAMAEGRLRCIPSVEELEQGCLVCRAREHVVDHARDGVHGEPLVGARATDGLGANVPESIDLERVPCVGRSVHGGRSLRCRGAAQVGRNSDAIRVDEARRACRDRLVVEDGSGAGVLPQPRRIQVHLRAEQQVLVVRRDVDHRDLLGLVRDEP